MTDSTRARIQALCDRVAQAYSAAAHTGVGWNSAYTNLENALIEAAGMDCPRCHTPKMEKPK